MMIKHLIVIYMTIQGSKEAYYPKLPTEILQWVNTEKSLQHILYRISFAYFRCNFGIENGEGKL